MPYNKIKKPARVTNKRYIQDLKVKNYKLYILKSLNLHDQPIAFVDYSSLFVRAYSNRATTELLKLVGRMWLSFNPHALHALGF